MSMQQVIKISLNLSYSEKLWEDCEVDFPLEILCNTTKCNIELWDYTMGPTDFWIFA